ncbi:NAD(P)H-flavin reductase [Thermodesulfitimonas autotrophica]|uniref:NAD(P)H-flavin reductase n=1 Tax=Thermodesulfitimonas autotrophica TaxID=1894989 RepID=A0A3N5BFI5_9THEO|nr:FAD/NAD(P)-binding protein [Thermodesulfitimonas autotrophica]RPF42811.1 NAD(P)H-flavin reductase [Thermodesulfitimonas autotrophica]
MKVANPLLPQPATIIDIIQETGDVKTFRVVLDDPDAMAAWRHRPGQTAMVSVFGVGEAMFCLASSPTSRDWIEFSIRRAGKVTTAIHQLEPGAKIGVRGPYGNSFPVEAMRGNDLLVIGGGIGLAPLRPLVNFMIAPENRKDYGNIEIIYGARSYGDLCYKEEVFRTWPETPGVTVWTTIDAPEEGWEGHVGFVPAYVAEIKPAPENKFVAICGPPVMIKFTLKELEKLGFKEEQIYTTLEMRMKCGIGKCGRCNIGAKFVCRDGPVFNLAALKELPPEY